MNDITAKHEPGHGVGGHVVSPAVLLSTFGALLSLTAITVAVSRMSLGEMNVVVALGVACTKAALVASFFMHLKYEGRFNLVLLLSSVFFLIVLLAFVIYDTSAYHDDIESYRRDHPRTPVAAPATE
jgi:cytochrome c oxidase subunit 4